MIRYSKVIMTDAIRSHSMEKLNQEVVVSQAIDLPQDLIDLGIRPQITGYRDYLDAVNIGGKDVQTWLAISQQWLPEVMADNPRELISSIFECVGLNIRFEDQPRRDSTSKEIESSFQISNSVGDITQQFTGSFVGVPIIQMPDGDSYRKIGRYLNPSGFSETSAGTIFYINADKLISNFRKREVSFKSRPIAVILSTPSSKQNEDLLDHEKLHAVDPLIYERASLRNSLPELVILNEIISVCGEGAPTTPILTEETTWLPYLKRMDEGLKNPGTYISRSFKRLFLQNLKDNFTYENIGFAISLFLAKLTYSRISKRSLFLAGVRSKTFEDFIRNLSEKTPGMVPPQIRKELPEELEYLLEEEMLPGIVFSLVDDKDGVFYFRVESGDHSHVKLQRMRYGSDAAGGYLAPSGEFYTIQNDIYLGKGIILKNLKKRFSIPGLKRIKIQKVVY